MTANTKAGDIFIYGLVAALLVCVCALFYVCYAEAPAYIAWDASQFMHTAKVSRYLNNGSSIEHKYVTLKAAKVCNGYSADPPAKTCAFRLDEVDDLNYSYRIKEYDRDGKQVADSLCTPMNTRWQCLPAVR